MLDTLSYSKFGRIMLEESEKLQMKMARFFHQKPHQKDRTNKGLIIKQGVNRCGTTQTSGTISTTSPCPTSEGELSNTCFTNVTNVLTHSSKICMYCIGRFYHFQPQNPQPKICVLKTSLLRRNGRRGMLPI